ncbi:MAG: polysaccharide biosynthesis C-terminal domain-containing protein, partial [Trueperaceae bacterium]|nr:polysaccharide biosynthesis C-terminal domain-containing protein [Trueperaceae bacterium]
IGQAVSAFSGSVGFLMSLTGHHNQAALFVLGVLLLNVSLNFLLIPQFGMNGAAVATSASFIIWNMAALFYVLRTLKINPTVLRRFW